VSQSVDCGYTGVVFILTLTDVTDLLEQCFSTASPRPSTGPWHQL